MELYIILGRSAATNSSAGHASPSRGGACVTLSFLPLSVISPAAARATVRSAESREIIPTNAEP